MRNVAFGLHHMALKFGMFAACWRDRGERRRSSFMVDFCICDIYRAVWNAEKL